MHTFFFLFCFYTNPDDNRFRARGVSTTPSMKTASSVRAGAGVHGMLVISFIIILSTNYGYNSCSNQEWRGAINPFCQPSTPPSRGVFLATTGPDLTKWFSCHRSGFFVYNI